MNIGRKFIRFADALHWVNAVLCAILLVAIFAVQFVVVLLRYAFSAGFLELQDIVAYCFAVVVVMSIPLALRLDRHVRVEVFREGQGPALRFLSDGLAVVVLLVPVFGLTLFHAMPGVVQSWSIGEGSVEPGGLPGYFAVKSALPVACALMIVQGIAIAIGARQPYQAGHANP